jgi:hypothetical protein
MNKALDVVSCLKLDPDFLETLMFSVTYGGN